MDSVSPMIRIEAPREMSLILWDCSNGRITKRLKIVQNSPISQPCMLERDDFAFQTQTEIHCGIKNAFTDSLQKKKRRKKKKPDNGVRSASQTVSTATAYMHKFGFWGYMRKFICSESRRQWVAQIVCETIILWEKSIIQNDKYVIPFVRRQIVWEIVCQIVCTCLRTVYQIVCEICLQTTCLRTVCQIICEICLQTTCLRAGSMVVCELSAKLSASWQTNCLRTVCQIVYEISLQTTCLRAFFHRKYTSIP